MRAALKRKDTIVIAMSDVRTKWRFRPLTLSLSPPGRGDVNRDTLKDFTFPRWGEVGPKGRVRGIGQLSTLLR